MPKSQLPKRPARPRKPKLPPAASLDAANGERDGGDERGHDERDEVAGVVEVLVEGDLVDSVVRFGRFEDEMHE